MSHDIIELYIAKIRECEISDLAIVNNLSLLNSMQVEVIISQMSWQLCEIISLYVNCKYFTNCIIYVNVYHSYVYMQIK